MKTVPAFKLVPHPLTPEAAALPRFGYAGPVPGTRHQLGGMPTDLVPPESWPPCPDCREAMTFYGQLDSINDEFCIADAGVLQVFICLECNEAVARIASA